LGLFFGVTPEKIAQSPKENRIHLKTLLNTLLSPFNLAIGRRLPGGLLIDRSKQDMFESAYRLVRANTMLNRHRLALVFELADYCVGRGIAGSFVECGVWKGGAVGMMACAARNAGEERDIHLCDVFDDIGEPDWRVDGERAVREAGGTSFAQGRLKPIKGIYDRQGGHGTEDACRTLIEQKIGWPPERIHVHRGWFQETLPILKKTIGPVAILRIDADWYASTKTCFDNIYDCVVTGGAVVVDDYGGYEGCRKAVDEFLAARRARPFLNHVDEECIYWFKD
jgi:O-methyltransferase